MQIHLKELPQGTSERSFEVPAATLDGYLRGVDGLYAAAGEPARVEMILDRFDDMIVVRGQISFPYRFECARCLEERQKDRQILLNWSLLPTKALNTDRLSDEEEVELASDDLDVSFFSGEEIDLSDLAREAIVLDFDPVPTCGEPECDSRLAELQQKAFRQEDEVDPRWSDLVALKEKLKQS